jgi:hypothetical protein|tara:strand:- start:765 stop:1040 length:276 start_codon:yes stop_codon:yes gene_type:complete
MANITYIKGQEIALPTTTGTATSFEQARMVRLVNLDGSSQHTVYVVETQSGTGIGSFSLPSGSVEYVQKDYTHCMYALSANVKGAKVGFTN